jgi:hypothetical protein
LAFTVNRHIEIARGPAVVRIAGPVWNGSPGRAGLGRDDNDFASVMTERAFS